MPTGREGRDGPARGMGRERDGSGARKSPARNLRTRPAPADGSAGEATPRHRRCRPAERGGASGESRVQGGLDETRPSRRTSRWGHPDRGAAARAAPWRNCRPRLHGAAGCPQAFSSRERVRRSAAAAPDAPREPAAPRSMPRHGDARRTRRWRRRSPAPERRRRPSRRGDRSRGSGPAKRRRGRPPSRMRWTARHARRRRARARTPRPRPPRPGHGRSRGAPIGCRSPQPREAAEAGGRAVVASDAWVGKLGSRPGGVKEHAGDAGEVRRNPDPRPHGRQERVSAR